MKQYTDETFHFDLSDEKIQAAVTTLKVKEP
jgi:hypothetical protein